MMPAIRGNPGYEPAGLGVGKAGAPANASRPLFNSITSSKEKPFCVG
jgi:hypothetical protein